ncbi:glycosyl hydrolase family 28 protein [Saccharicrinis fermentans]|uniref:Glycosyl hydrolase family 28 n=1 Tax=Saccharicrinis fermentans DSM 9555 = JCM 21142 TaxID=869213 RepID=W7YC96_9BACT|nr:glycosyl hydrolase family 28 protein [Saccharicrinis fermentans]GAF05078.1 glycosyl hydrolase family 28 [Saccharicrinis fermentans DSM 9555 = JCM 21142]
MNLFRFLQGLIIVLFFEGAVSSQKLMIYSVPNQIKYSGHNDDFTVQVKQNGGVWRDLFEYNVKVDLDNPQDASMVTFDFEGSVEVRVKKNNGKVREVKIRPSSLGIKHEVIGNDIFFRLDKPVKLSIEINGDRLHNLHLFANPVLKDIPQQNDPNIIYFGPGYHKPGDQPGNVYHIPSGKTVYLDGGAVVNGKFLIDRAKDVKIMGHGIVWHPERGVEIRYSENVYIDGPVFINPSHYTVYGGQVDGLTIENIKSFSCRGWSDGIDLMSCSNVNINDVFLRNSDDCIALYGHRWQFYGSARNIVVKNSVLWADVAHPTNMGLHGNAKAGGDSIENVTFTNLDILEHDEDDPNYQGCFAISNTDNNLVRNITYRNIRIEGIQEGQLFNFRTLYNEKYSGAPGRNVEGVLLENISYTGGFVNPSTIGGYSNERKVDGVRFKNVTINGEPFSLDSRDHVHLKEFISDIKVK